MNEISLSWRIKNSHKISYKMSSSKKLGEVILGQFYVKIGSIASKVKKISKCGLRRYQKVPKGPNKSQKVPKGTKV